MDSGEVSRTEAAIIESNSAIFMLFFLLFNNQEKPFFSLSLSSDHFIRMFSFLLLGIRMAMGFVWPLWGMFPVWNFKEVDIEVHTEWTEAGADVNVSHNRKALLTFWSLLPSEALVIWPQRSFLEQIMPPRRVGNHHHIVIGMCGQQKDQGALALGILFFCQTWSETPRSNFLETQSESQAG